MYLTNRIHFLIIKMLIKSIKRYCLKLNPLVAENKLGCLHANFLVWWLSFYSNLVRSHQQIWFVSFPNWWFIKFFSLLIMLIPAFLENKPWSDNPIQIFVFSYEYRNFKNQTKTSEQSFKRITSMLMKHLRFWWPI